MKIRAQPRRAAGQLSAMVRRANGSVENRGVVSSDESWVQPISFWRRMWVQLARAGKLKGITFSVFLAWMLRENYGFLALPLFGLVTNAGVDYQGDDFAGGSSDVSNFKYHESGTGTTAAAVTDTGIETGISLARVTGTNSKPGSWQFQSTGEIAYASTLSISEWALMSSAGSGLPPTGGTCWDRRIISPSAGVQDGDSITFEYVCTFTSGGS